MVPFNKQDWTCISDWSDQHISVHISSIYIYIYLDMVWYGPKLATPNLPMVQSLNYIFPKKNGHLWDARCPPSSSWVLSALCSSSSAEAAKAADFWRIFGRKAAANFLRRIRGGVSVVWPMIRLENFLGGDWKMAGLWLSIYWKCHHPNWQTPSFFKMVRTINQLSLWFTYEKWRFHGISIAYHGLEW